MYRISIIALVAALWSPSIARADAASDAAVLHAEGLMLELDGDPSGGLDLFREAVALAPEDREIAFDLARVALDLSDTAADADLKPFMSRAPASSDERKLLAYILAERDDLEHATEIINAAPIADETPDAFESEATPAPDATDMELAELRAELAAYLEAKQAMDEPDFFSADLTLGVQGDSNVTLVARRNAPGVAADPQGSGVAAARFIGTANLYLRPFTSLPGFETSLTLEATAHLTDRKACTDQTSNRCELGAYDSTTTLLRTAILQPLGPLELYAEAYGTLVTARNVRTIFMLDGGGIAELRWPMLFTPGVYLEAGYRDFRDGNKDFTPGFAPTAADLASGVITLDDLAQFDDRDGPRIAAGLTLDWFLDNFGLAARFGFQTETVDGPHQVQRGIDASLQALLSLGGFDVAAGMIVEWRRYANWPGGRTDIRLMPQADLGYAFTDWLSVRASYLFMLNGSSGVPRPWEEIFGQDQSLAYTRHLLTFGVEGRI